MGASPRLIDHTLAGCSKFGEHFHIMGFAKATSRWGGAFHPKRGQCMNRTDLETIGALVKTIASQFWLELTVFAVFVAGVVVLAGT